VALGSTTQIPNGSFISYGLNRYVVSLQPLTKTASHPNKQVSCGAGISLLRQLASIEIKILTQWASPQPQNSLWVSQKTFNNRLPLLMQTRDGGIEAH
jgi:hypothetical protein